MIFVISALQEEGNDDTHTGRHFNSYNFKVVGYNSYCLIKYKSNEVKGVTKLSFQLPRIPKQQRKQLPQIRGKQ